MEVVVFMAGPVKYDWTKIKKDYVEGILQNGELVFPTAEDISKKYGVSIPHLRQKSQNEQWMVERENYIQGIESYRIERKQELLGQQAAELDIKVFNVAQEAIDELLKMIQNEKQKDGKSDVNVFNKVSTSLKNFQDIAKNASNQNFKKDDFLTWLDAIYKINELQKKQREQDNKLKLVK